MKKKRYTGNSLFEFILIVPIFLILVMGLIDISVLLYDKIIITDASREGARYGVVVRSDGYATLEDVQAHTLNFCANKLISFGASPSVTVSAISSNPEPSFGDTLTVTVNYQYTGLALLSNLNLSYNLTATNMMSYE